MHRISLVLFSVIAGFCLPAITEAPKTVDFTIVDRIQFSVPADWPVIANKSTSEKTVFAFQIPNPADKDTSDSSNLAVVAADFKTADEKGTFQKAAPSANPSAVEKTLLSGWRCASYSAKQHSSGTEYVIWDCREAVVDCGVSVRLAWPHLPKNPPDYDHQMESVLMNFLSSVGPFKGLPKSGVLRRPEN